jgi:uncharacterized membrane protein
VVVGSLLVILIGATAATIGYSYLRNHEWVHYQVERRFPASAYDSYLARYRKITGVIFLVGGTLFVVVGIAILVSS